MTAAYEGGSDDWSDHCQTPGGVARASRAGRGPDRLGSGAAADSDELLLRFAARLDGCPEVRVPAVPRVAGRRRRLVHRALRLYAALPHRAHALRLADPPRVVVRRAVGVAVLGGHGPCRRR